MSGIAERLAEVLAEHVDQVETRCYPAHDCTCGEWNGAIGDNGSDTDGQHDNADAHRAHLADALLPVVEREIAAARGEVLREAAEEIERVERIGQTSVSETATAELEWFHEHPLRNVDGYQRHRPVVAAWLRDRVALSSDPDRGESDTR